MLASSLLAAVPGIRHAFFSRDGGVSDGVYAGLNGGLGSNDDPARVAENRRRMAEQLGVAPTHLVSAHQIHSPDVYVATGPYQPWAKTFGSKCPDPDFDGARHYWPKWAVREAQRHPALAAVAGLAVALLIAGSVVAIRRRRAA